MCASCSTGTAYVGGETSAETSTLNTTIVAPTSRIKPNLLLFGTADQVGRGQAPGAETTNDHVTMTEAVPIGTVRGRVHTVGFEGTNYQ